MLRDDRPDERARRLVDVSVVIPARDAARTLAMQLAALTRQDFSGTWEVLVVDNGSSDATVEVAESFRDTIPNLRVVGAHDRAGINVARNAGVREASGSVIAFCDADDQVRADWLSGIVAAMIGNDAVAGRLDLSTLNGGPSGPNGDQHAVGPLSPTPSRSGVLRFLPYPVGANCAVRRDVWQALGGFDESIVYGGDEVDFFWRLQLAGYTLGDAPDAWVAYRLPQGTRSNMRSGFAKGRASATLYADFRAHGARFDALRATRNWVGLLVRSYQLLMSGRTRRAWLVRAAQQAGRLWGGLKHRCVYF